MVDVELHSFASLLKSVVDNRGKTCPTADKGIPLIATNCIVNSHLYPAFEKVRYVDEVTYKTWFRGHPQPDDMIFVLKGTPGRVSWVPNPVGFCIAQDMVAIRADSEKVYPKYLFAVLRSSIIQQEIEGLHVGSLIPHFKKGDFNDLKIPIIKKSLQQFVGDSYFEISQKIDLLHRQNTTLERMAETLFRQWFIEEVQESWPRMPLGEFVTIKRGGSPRPIQEFLSESGYRWLKISDVTSLNSPFIFNIKEHIKVEGLRKTVLLNAGSLVLSNSATPGIPKILTIDSCIHDGWLHFPNSYFSNEFLYLLFNHIRPELISHGNGSIFTNLKTDILKEFVIPIPNECDLKVFQNQIKSIFDKLLSNAKQIQTIEKLRDNLLPKLMSGEIKLS